MPPNEEALVIGGRPLIRPPPLLIPALPAAPTTAQKVFLQGLAINLRGITYSVQYQNLQFIRYKR